MVLPNHNTFFAPGISLTNQVSTNEQMVVMMPMNMNLPKAPIQMLSVAYCRTIISNRWKM